MIPVRSSRQPRRNRIVINLDNPQASRRTARNARRWTRVLTTLAAIAVGTVIVIAAAAYAWWQHYKTAPAYSLALLIDDVQRNDVTTVHQLVDADKVVDNLCGQ